MLEQLVSILFSLQLVLGKCCTDCVPRATGAGGKEASVVNVVRDDNGMLN